MSTETTTQVNIPPATPQEQALQASQLEVAQAQLQAIQDQSVFQQEQFAALTPLIEGQIADAATARARAEELAPLQQQLLDAELERINRGGAATPEQQRLIGEVTERGIAGGESDIAAFQKRVLDQLANELAPSLGLRPSDSPIIDRGGRIAEEGLRLQSSLVNSLRGAQAQAELNFPLAIQQFQSGATQFQQGLAQQKEQFAQQLSQQAFANRLNLTGQAGSTGLGLISAANPQTASVLSSLGNLRAAGASQTSSTSDPFGVGIQLIGALGGGLTGLGSIGVGTG